MFDAWKKFTTAMSNKRTDWKTNKPNNRSASILKKGEIVVQRLSSDVHRKAQKYAINVIYVCFVVASNDSCPWEADSSCPSNSTAHVTGYEKRLQEETTPLPNPKLRAKETSSFPKSLSVLEMIKLVTVEKDTSTAFELFEFDVHDMTWSTNCRTLFFIVDEQVLAANGFREVFKATSDAREFADSTWVIKKYLPEAVTIIGKTNQTVEEHTKKVVQMHMLAKNLAEEEGRWQIRRIRTNFKI